FSFPLSSLICFPLSSRQEGNDGAPAQARPAQLPAWASCPDKGSGACSAGEEPGPLAVATLAGAPQVAAQRLSWAGPSRGLAGAAALARRARRLRWRAEPRQ
ncbi:unnamed protein product, partial [Urochloa humidicola]